MNCANSHTQLCENDTFTCSIHTHAFSFFNILAKTRFRTQARMRFQYARVISTCRVWFRHARVRLPHLECCFHMQSLILTHTTVFSMRTSVISTHLSWESGTHKCYFYTHGAISTSRIWFRHPQVWLRHARVLFLHAECDIHRLSAIFMRTSETSTCRVLFLHSWVVNMTHPSVISRRKERFPHAEYDFHTQNAIPTRSFWFWHLRVWFWYACVLFLHAECNIYTQSAIFIRLKIHLFLRLYCTHCTHSLICSFMSIRKKNSAVRKSFNFIANLWHFDTFYDYLFVM
jgi:hypothetical protein